MSRRQWAWWKRMLDCGATALACAAIIWAAPALAQETGTESPHGRDVINDWIAAAQSGSRLLIVGTGAFGIILAAVSLTRAYNAMDERSRTRHLLGALWGGVITITGVIIGVISRMLVPG